ncbi:MAG: hypothetical protein ACKOOF_00525 [Planctomycetaceae bacterium]
MNTYRIYEDFKASLGEGAAKALAQTLGTMFEELRDTVTKEDFRILRESIDVNTSRLDTALTRLAEAQGRTEAKVAELAEGQARLAEAQSRTEVKVAELAEAQARTEAEVKSLTVAMQRLTTRTDAVVGRTFEIQFRDRLTSYLGRLLRRGKLLANDELLDVIEPHVDDHEVDDFLRADAVASGLVDGQKTYVVVEVSSTGDIEDIVRAERRAGVLRKAGLAAIPLVACEVISPESLAFAKQSQVKVWRDGSIVEVDAAA